MSAHSSAFIESGAHLGEGVTIGAGVHVPEGVSIGDGAVIGDGVVFACPPGPPPSSGWQTGIGRKVFVGGGSVILQGVSIGDGAIIQPGTVVAEPIPSNSVVQGNPATITGYVDAVVAAAQAGTAAAVGVSRVGVGAVTLHRLPIFSDIRGSLTVGEFERSIPFMARRYFMVFDVPSRETRGEHAHRECHQFLICVSGSCAVVVDDGRSRSEILLQGADMGIHLPPMIWGTQYKYSKDSTLLVFTSHYYDNEDYIRDYQDFLHLVGRD